MTKFTLSKAGASGAILILVLIAIFFFKKPSESVVLPIPFTSQAPNGNWDRNEDCEETSITMAKAYLDGITVNLLPAAEAADAINKLRNWENVNIGYNIDTGVDATKKMAQGAFNLKVKELPNFTADDLKKEIAAKNVVLLPHNARLLNNPKYLENGPTYHMLVIRGYRGNTFIVNDPGTESGNGNEYTFETLKNAAADWNQSAQRMEPDRKIALILSK